MTEEVWKLITSN